MLRLVIKAVEYYDEINDVFVDQNETVLELEHSLVSLSKWESFFEKPFLSKNDKTHEEILWYVQAMCLDPNVPPEVFSRLDEEHLTEINKYINKKMTATRFYDIGGEKKNTEIITAELIYYWMIAFTIPVEFQHWHLERLLTLIRVCNLKNSKPKKMSRAEWAAKQRAINEQRLAELGTTG